MINVDAHVETHPGGVEGVRDEVLVRRVAESGDGRALSELYDRYGGVVFGAGLRYLLSLIHI
jgi:hypothetical protein